MEKYSTTAGIFKIPCVLVVREVGGKNGHGI
jgi:hypothetical protein